MLLSVDQMSTARFDNFFFWFVIPLFVHSHDTNAVIFS